MNLDICVNGKSEKLEIPEEAIKAAADSLLAQARVYNRQAKEHNLDFAEAIAGLTKQANDIHEFLGRVTQLVE